MNTDAIRDFTLWARALLVQETGDLLRGIYGLKENGTFFPATDMPALQAEPGAQDAEQVGETGKRQETRRRLEQLIADEKDADVKPDAAMAKLVKEVAFTHLNRLVAFKMLEYPDRRVVKRAAIAGYPEPNGFRMYLPDHAEDYSLYELGTTPLDALNEGPRDRAYRHFLLWQCGELAREIRILFDPDNLPSRLFPRPKVLRQLIERLNGDELKEAWQVDNEETVGWVYQYFNSEELEAAFAEARLSGKKFTKEDIPSVTQLFTPRPTVRFLVHNTLGRFWLSMHSDSKIEQICAYLAPLPADPPAVALKPVKEIRVLDPATGTMHFGLIAFDLLTEMYREEISNAGKLGWPNQPSVATESEIPAAILANNLFGIDIDLRAVQLAALALYLKAKTASESVVLTESNLACADVAIFRGPHLAKITSEMELPQDITRDLFVKFRDSLEEASMMGSLVRLEKHFQNFEGNQLRRCIDAYVAKKRAEGIDESYFANETGKGLRLLELLELRYDVVFTNPPYVSARKMNGDMSRFMKANYKNAKGDLYAAFIERCLELTSDSGVMGMLTMHSFMFISSYEKLRATLSANAVIETVAHYGPGLFSVGNPGTLQTAAFVLRRAQFEMERQQARGVYFRLVKATDAESKQTAFELALACHRAGQPDSRVYEYRQADFAAIPGSPWVYWITPSLRSLFRKLRKLEDVAQPRVGLQTGFNARFLRYWWESGLPRIERSATNAVAAAASGKRWFPYMKGGSFQRWFGNQKYVVNWFDDGREIKACTPNSVIRNPDYYFQRGVTWSDLTAGKFSARLSPGGFIFDVKGSSAFPDDIPLVLGLLNSSFANYTLNLINPTLSYQVGDIARLPVPKQSSDSLRNRVDRTIALTRAENEEDETTFDFIEPPAWKDGVEHVTARLGDLDVLAKEIDEEVYRLYEISVEDCKAIEDELSSPSDAVEASDDEDVISDTDTEEVSQLTQQELATEWIRYAVGVALGRFEPGVIGALGCGSFAADVAARLRDLADKDGIMVLEEGHPDDLARRVVNVLSTIYGDAEAEGIVRTATESTAPLRNAVDAYFTGAFFRDHIKRYRKCPIYWLIQSPKKNYSVYLFHEKATPDTLSLLRGSRYLGGRLNRLQQEQATLRAASLKGDKGATKKAGLVAELIEELQEFDRRIEATSRIPVKDKDGRDVTVRWEPELDDGVYINAAPLHELLPSWRDVTPKKAWQELAVGDYDWSRTAMRYWPQRVRAKCKDNKSYTIAHGLA